MTAYRIDDKNIDLIETIAALLESDGDKTKAAEFYERLADVDSKNKLALEKLAIFRESIGDYYGSIEYMDRLKAIDPRNQFVKDNYEKIKDQAENGGFGAFLKKIFGRKMGV